MPALNRSKNRCTFHILGRRPGLKRLGLLVEEYPKVESHPQITAELNAFRTLVRDHGVTLRTYEIRSGKDIEGAITAIAKDRTQLIILWNSPLTVVHRNTIIVGVAARGIPIISEGREMAEAGALLTYSPNFFDMWRRSAVYVDKILKGAKPGDLPIEQATKFSPSSSISRQARHWASRSQNRSWCARTMLSDDSPPTRTNQGAVP